MSLPCLQASPMRAVRSAPRITDRGTASDLNNSGVRFTARRGIGHEACFHQLCLPPYYHGLGALVVKSPRPPRTRVRGQLRRKCERDTGNRVPGKPRATLMGAAQGLRLRRAVAHPCSQRSSDRPARRSTRTVKSRSQQSCGPRQRASRSRPLIAAHESPVASEDLRCSRPSWRRL